MRSNLRRSHLALGLAALVAAPLSGQVPPPELKAHVLMDVGPLPAPTTCGCATAPFTFTPLRPGWGYGSGPAAPDTDAPPSTDERRHQREIDAETRQFTPVNVEDGLAGNYAASFSIALELTTGTALKRDDVEAARWFFLAASQGHDNAYIQLGHRYHRGLGLPQDDSAAAYWFYEGASRGDNGAMVALGGLYAAGRGVPQNWTTAVSWWRKAGHWRFVGDAYACGLGVAQDNERAAAAYKKGADGNDMSSTVQLAHMHASGCAVPADSAVAYKLYEAAAQQGYPEAQVALSDLLLRGRGVAADPLGAYLWARLAELRIPDGALRALARTRAAQAARRLSPAETASTEAMVKAMVANGAEPMNR